MSLLRAVLALIVVLILAHIVVFRLDYDPATNEVVAAVYSLGELVEYPAWALLPDASFYAVALIRFTAEHSLLLRRIRPPMVIGMAADQLSLLTQSHATLYERLLQLVEVLKQAVGHRFVGQRP